MAEEGLNIKRVEIDVTTEIENENIEKITIESKNEIKIILEFQLIEKYRVVAVLREDRLVVIDLKNM